MKRQNILYASVQAHPFGVLPSAHYYNWKVLQIYRETVKYLTHNITSIPCLIWNGSGCQTTPSRTAFRVNSAPITLHDN
jgi:hypothetical protein